MTHRPFSVLFVCTGNICRSPVAERLFRARLPAGADVVVSSAGVRGLPGWGIDGPSATALSELGVDPTGHRARRVDAATQRSADLVLTASEEHRAVLLQAEPTMLAKTFTLREFGRLADADPADADPGVAGTAHLGADDLRGRVRSVAARRGLVSAPTPGADDIADPYGASLGIARTTAADIARAVDLALRALGLG